MPLVRLILRIAAGFTVTVATGVVSQVKPPSTEGLTVYTRFAAPVLAGKFIVLLTLVEDPVVNSCV